MDAAILFSDLLLPLEPMGLPFDFIKGEGPQIERPIESPADIDRLRVFEPREALAHVLDGHPSDPARAGGPRAAHRVRRRAVHAGVVRHRRRPLEQLRAHQGADVRPSGRVAPALRAARRRRRPTTCSRRSTPASTRCRCSTRGSARLNAADYREFALPHTRADLRRRSGTGCRRFISAPARRRSSRSCATPAATSSASDWRIPIDEAWERIGSDRAVQGNLDPTLLLGPRAAHVHARPTTSSRASPGGPATSSTSATASCRRRRSSTCRCSRSTSTAHPAVPASEGGSSAGPHRDRRQSSTSPSSAAVSPAWRPPTSCSGAARVRVLEADSAARRRHHHRTVDGWVIDGGPDSLLVQKPAAVALCRELGSPTASSRRSSRAPRTSCATGGCTRSSRARSSDFRSAFGALAVVALHAARQAAHGVRSRSCRAARGDDDESIARVRQAPVRRGGGRLPGGAAAGRHSRRRRRAAVDARAVSAAARSGAPERQRHPRVPRDARHARRRSGAFVSLPGGIGELVDALVGALAPRDDPLSARVSPTFSRAGVYRAQDRDRSIEATRGDPQRPGVRGGGVCCAGSTRRSPASASHPVRVDGHRRLRLPARPDSASAQGHRLRGAARGAQPAARRHVGDVEVAGPGAGGTCPRARRSSAAAATRTASTQRTTSSSPRPTMTLAELLGITGGPCSRGSSDGHGRARSTRSDISSASPSIERRLASIPGLFSPGADSARSAFPTASPTAGGRPPRRPRTSRHDEPDGHEARSHHRRAPRPRRWPTRRGHGTVRVPHRRPRRSDRRPGQSCRGQGRPPIADSGDAAPCRCEEEIHP